MPLYEFRCAACGARDEVFARSVNTEVVPPACPTAPGQPGHDMTRAISAFARRLTLADQLSEAEARFGKEVDAVMGKEPDVGRFARRYDQFAQNLPGSGDL